MSTFCGILKEEHFNQGMASCVVGVQAPLLVMVRPLINLRKMSEAKLLFALPSRLPATLMRKTDSIIFMYQWPMICVSTKWRFKNVILLINTS